MDQHIDRYFLKAQLAAYAREHGHMAALECIAWFFERCNGKLRGTFSAEKLNMEEAEEALEKILRGPFSRGPSLRSGSRQGFGYSPE
jgi:hypothetical protein